MEGQRRSPRLILAVIAFGVFVAADDLTVVSTMLRQIIFDLEIPLPDGLDDAAWIVNAYLIAYVVVMPFVGRLSDLFGRRLVFIASFGLFLIGSIWLPFTVALDPDIRLPAFIVGRVLTALGGGAMVPVGMAVIGDVYPPDRRATPLGFLGAVDTAGWVWGPLYGALLVRFLSWQWQFYLNIPLSIIGIAAAWWVLRDLPRAQGGRRVDWLGVGLLTLALLALNVALLDSGDIQSVTSLTELEDEASVPIVPLYIIAALAFAAFIWVERHRQNRIGSGTSPPPLIDLGLFRRPNFSPAVAINFVVGATLIIAMVNVPLFVNVLQLDLEQAALESGWLLSALTATMAVAAYVGGRLTELWGYRRPAAAGLLLCATGFLLMGARWSVATPYTVMAWQLALVGAGFGLVTAPTGAAVINAAPAPKRGIAASLVIVFRLLGMSVGLSALTGWGLYRFNVLRVTIELPPMTDPSFASALAEALTTITASVLAETFLVSGFVVAVGFMVSLLLRADKNNG